MVRVEFERTRDREVMELLWAMNVGEVGMEIRRRLAQAFAVSPPSDDIDGRPRRQGRGRQRRRSTEPPASDWSEEDKARRMSDAGATGTASPARPGELDDAGSSPKLGTARGNLGGTSDDGALDAETLAMLRGIDG
jgi:hypothetical protein